MEELGEEIRGREEVTNTVYISEDEAWDSFREDFLDSEELREGIFEGDNPLAGCDSYEVYINDISRQEEFVAYVKSLEGVGDGDPFVRGGECIDGAEGEDHGDRRRMSFCTDSAIGSIDPKHASGYGGFPER